MHKVAWIEDKTGRVLSINKNIRENTNPKFSITGDFKTEFSLVIEDVEVNMSGSYSCSVSTIPELRSRVYLKVIPKEAEIVNITGNHSVIEGSATKLTCNIERIRDYKVN